MRTTLSTLLVLGLISDFPLVQVAAIAQNRLTSSQLLSAAKEAFLNDRAKINYLTYPKNAWFEGFEGELSERNKSLRIVNQNLKVKENWSVKGKAEPGDLVRIRWTQSGKTVELFLVYAGEERFPDAPSLKSFFIYPYRTHLEYNTFPARASEAFLNAQFDRWKLAESVFSYTEPDSQHGGTRWVQIDPDSALSILIKQEIATSATNGTGTATIFRPTIEASPSLILVEERTGVRKNESIYAEIDFPGDVGIESELARSSFVDQKSGKRRIVLGKVAAPGVYFVTAHVRKNSVVSVPVLVVGEAGDTTFSVTTAPFAELTVPASPKLVKDMARLQELQSAKGSLDRWNRAVKKAKWQELGADFTRGHGSEIYMCAVGVTLVPEIAALPCYEVVGSVAIDGTLSVVLAILRQYNQELYDDGLLKSEEEMNQLNSLLTMGEGAIGLFRATDAIDQSLTLIGSAATLACEERITDKWGDACSVAVRIQTLQGFVGGVRLFISIKK